MTMFLMLVLCIWSVGGFIYATEPTNNPSCYAPRWKSIAFFAIAGPMYWAALGTHSLLEHFVK